LLLYLDKTVDGPVPLFSIRSRVTSHGRASPNETRMMLLIPKKTRMVIGFFGPSFRCLSLALSQNKENRVIMSRAVLAVACSSPQPLISASVPVPSSCSLAVVFFVPRACYVLPPHCNQHPHPPWHLSRAHFLMFV
jgi:hypothetical protein